jgi:hypothetical protein
MSAPSPLDPPRPPAGNLPTYRLVASATNAAVLIGALFATWGALTGSYVETGAGVALLLASVALFAVENRLSRAWIGAAPVAPAPSSSSPPWWKRPRVYPGKWLCTSCGWREDVTTLRCPRCGRPMARLSSRAPDNA